MDLDKLIEIIDVEAFVRDQGIALSKKSGSGWYGDCPFCYEKKKFSINTSDSDRKGLWKCFKCGETGNAITLYAKLHGCTNGDAVKAIKEFAGVRDEDLVIRAPAPKPSNKPQSGKKSFKLIYQRLVELCKLSQEHREELKQKRGFSDSLIDELKFRSGGEYIVKVIEQLRSEFDDEDLIKKGVLLDVNGTIAINDQLLGNRVLIPYLDSKGTVHHIRPHKLGFAKIPAEPYAKYFLRDKPSSIVLTEGEFKAAALYGWGIPAIAIPGISSFGDTNFDRLVYLLKEFGVKNVVVIYDNEDKSNPALPNFKRKVEDRYDTQYWAYMMAYKLTKAGYPSKVGWLPDEWREDGKIDFDAAMAQGRTKTDIERIIDAAVTPSEYLKSLDEEAQRIVKRKLNRHFSKINIRREFNKYVAVRNKGGEQWEETISNFVINIKSSAYTAEGVIRNVEFVNEYGEVSDVFPLLPSYMAGINEFRKFCFGKGNYVFEGEGRDLLNIWKYEFARDSGEFIYMPERIGRINKDLWLFGNMAIYKGEVYRPDNDGVIWIDGKGYKPQPFQISQTAGMEDNIPALSESEIDVIDVAQKLRASVGGYEAYMGIGWVVATIFSQDIFAKYKCMPILWPHGKRESGKSTFTRWLMNFFGIETEGYTISKTTTQNFIARALSYFSSLGVWFDEYRNEPYATQHDGFFRSAYNRQISGKGTATAFQTKGFTVNSSIVIAGENFPKDNGLFTRIIPLQFSAYKRDREYFDEINRLTPKLSWLTYYLIKNYDDLKEKVLQNIAELKDALVSRGLSDRAAENWAICAGAFDAVILQDDDFIRWVENTCQEIKQSGEDEHMLNQFWSDLVYLHSERIINNKHIRSEAPFSKLYIWFNGAYEAWSLHYKKKTGREPFDSLSLLNYLRDEPYFLGREQRRMDGAKRWVYVIDIPNSTETIQELANAVEEASELI